MILLLDAGSKRNTAGASKFTSLFHKCEWACEFWIAGFANQENLKIFWAPKNIVFRGTCWKFWL